MSISVVYWSGTGNTEAMANALAEGIREAGGEAVLQTADSVNAAELAKEDIFALGCPSMGAEELEESVMEPFVSELEGMVQGKQILSVNEKYYMVDHGIRQAVFGSNTRDINLVLENIVYMELLRRGYTVTVGKIGDLEIDLIGEKDGKRIYMQVCYILASEETAEREFGPYRYVKDNYPKYVVSMDEIDMSRDGIIHKNVRDLLTSEDW